MGFLDDLAQVAQDSQVRRLARRRARSLDLAEDALQDTYLAIARMREPESIRDLHAFFCRSLIHEINHLLAQPTHISAGESATADHARGQASLDTHTESSVHREAAQRLLTATLLTRLNYQSHQLAQSIPGRSTDQNRYRSTIIAATGRILALLLEGDVGPSDWNVILKQECPQWCDEAGLPRETMDQRLSRARRDVRSLLKQLVTRNELTQ